MQWYPARVFLPNKKELHDGKWPPVILCQAQMPECCAENVCDCHLCELPSLHPIHPHRCLHQQGCPVVGTSKDSPQLRNHQESTTMRGWRHCQKQGGAPSLCSPSCLVPPTPHPPRSRHPQVRESRGGAHIPETLDLLPEKQLGVLLSGMGPAGLIAHTFLLTQGPCSLLRSISLGAFTHHLESQRQRTCSPHFPASFPQESEPRTEADGAQS